LHSLRLAALTDAFLLLRRMLCQIGFLSVSMNLSQLAMFYRILDKASPMASGAIKSSLLIELGFG
jgi:hypothetical protein